MGWCRKQETETQAQRGLRWDGGEFVGDARRACVYRLYAADDFLLYLGVSVNPENRVKEHRRTKPWFSQVAYWTERWFDSEGDAYASEARCIPSEGPRYNGTHNDDWDEDKAALGRLLAPGVLARMYARQPIAVALGSIYLGSRIVDDVLPYSALVP